MALCTLNSFPLQDKVRSLNSTEFMSSTRTPVWAFGFSMVVVELGALIGISSRVFFVLPVARVSVSLAARRFRFAVRSLLNGLAKDLFPNLMESATRDELTDGALRERGGGTQYL